jgi:hypothetical protein
MALAEQSKERPEKRYYVTLDGQVRGPFDLELIEAMVLSGSFPARVPVCKVGSQEWSPLPVVQTVPTTTPTSTTEQPSRSSRQLGSKLILVIVAFIVALFALGALLDSLKKSELQQTSAKPSVTYEASPTPPPITPTYTPPVTRTYRDPAGTTYRVPQWAEQGLNAKKAALNAQEASLNSLKSQVESLHDQIEIERPRLDQTSQYAIDAFNREVDRCNSLNQQLKDGIDAFNAGVNDYNAELVRVGTPIN